MNATVTRQLFGPLGPGFAIPDVEIPVLYTTRKFLTCFAFLDSGKLMGLLLVIADKSCWGVVTSELGPDYSTWYNLWEGASAVEQMCIRSSLNGEARGIG